MSEVVIILTAIGGGALASIVTGIFTRPKMNAEAKQAVAGGEVSISGDAREWAKTFAERADRAEQKAQAAEERADAAEDAVDDVTRRCAETERKVDALITYVFTLQRQIRMSGEVPADPPSSLSPPL